MPHKNHSKGLSFFSLKSFLLSLFSLFALLYIFPRFLPGFQTTHSTLIDGPFRLWLYSSHSMCFTGLWAMWRIRTNVLVTQAGQRNGWACVSGLLNVAKSVLLQLNHLIRSWWPHLAGISPPHASREAASDMVINCRINTSISEVSCTLPCSADGNTVYCKHQPRVLYKW